MPPKTLKATVKEVRDDTDSVYTVIVEPEKKVAFEPGQFFFIYAQKDGQLKAKAYSVANNPEDEHIEFCIKRVEKGFMSNRLYRLTAGENITLGGPYGFFTLKESSKDLIFVATGTGVSAIRPMIHRLLNQGAQQQLHLLFGVRTQHDILFRKEFEKQAKQHENFHFIPVLSREQWQGEQGYVQDVLKKYWNKRDAEFYLCGLYPMIDTVNMMLLDHGIHKDHIHLERYV